MKLTKEEIAVRRKLVVKGMHIVADCPIRTVLPDDRPLSQRIAELHARIESLLRS